MNEAMTPAELAAACKVIADLFPPHPSKSVSVSVGTFLDSVRPGVAVYPVGHCGAGRHFYGDTFAEAFAAAELGAMTYHGNRRAEAQRKLAEAQAELAALCGEAADSLPVEVHHGVESAQ